ncbi:MAG: deoxyribodipyrimidine photo-lyase [Pseudomonadaceae bacterium]|nr:MAG: deoxyribodipyrimidine photo-lyase [Pseudomonadaceae bacterium]
MELVWFKRDLRSVDHQALSAAAERGPVLPIYVIEPELWQQPDSALRHWQFIADSLRELDNDLRERGQGLLVCEGEIISTLKQLHHRFGLRAVHSHEETGNGWTYTRDRSVARWLKAEGIEWHQYQQFGVCRPLANRDHWAGAWEHFMSQPQHQAPAQLQRLLATELPPLEQQLRGYEQSSCPGRQPGGRYHGLRLLRSFLGQRSRRYRASLSAPAAASRYCARLSSYLAYGCISLRELVQATDTALAEQPDPQWRASLQAFKSRLYWHCHFIQKLEDQPDIECLDLYPAMRGLRSEANPAHLAAWMEGRTGYPMIDACMRQLQHDGWLNFRMRACLMSFASYLLWLPWRDSALHLARQFTDYEPGIHYCQAQMQSGTTGINALRIYNPLKQSLEQDPEGDYIRHWVPELAQLPSSWIHQPWQLPDALQQQWGVRIGEDYPAPIVDHEAAARSARQRIKQHLHLQSGEQKAEWQEGIRQRHASRRRPSRRRQPSASSNQLTLDL